jgi:hypothetical protein
MFHLISDVVLYSNLARRSGGMKMKWMGEYKRKRWMLEVLRRFEEISLVQMRNDTRVRGAKTLKKNLP